MKGKAIMSNGIKVTIEENYTDGENNFVSSHQVFLTPKILFNKMRSNAIRFAQFSEQYPNITHYTCDGKGGYIIRVTNQKDLAHITDVIKSVSPFTVEEINRLKEYAGGMIKVTMAGSRIYFYSKHILEKKELFEPLNKCVFGDVFIDLKNGAFLPMKKNEDHSQVKEIIDNILAGELIKV